MSLKTPLFFLFVLISMFANAQQTMSVKGSQPYSATQDYTFICEKYVLSGEINAQIAKTEKGGILKLTILTANDNTKISGGVYVDLANADVIACVDKNVKESADGRTTAYYYFTPAEMNKLKKSDIYAIRFIVASNSSVFGNQISYYTAKNKKAYFSTAYDTSKKTFDTAKEISAL